MIDGRATSREAGSVAKLVSSCTWLTMSIVLVAPLFIWFGFSRAAWNGALAAGIAGGICWLAGILALIVAYFANRRGNGVHGVFAGMLIRMGLPLASGLVLERQSAVLAEAGIFPLVLGFYLFVLVIETLLSLRFVGADRRGAAAS